MNAGFWLSAAVLATGAAVAAWLLPDQIRTHQVRRDEPAPDPGQLPELAV